MITHTKLLLLRNYFSVTTAVKFIASLLFLINSILNVFVLTSLKRTWKSQKNDAQMTWCLVRAFWFSNLYAIFLVFIWPHFFLYHHKLNNSLKNSQKDSFFEISWTRQEQMRIDPSRALARTSLQDEWRPFKTTLCFKF